MEINDEGTDIVFYADNKLFIFNLNTFKIQATIETKEEFFSFSFLKISGQSKFLICGGESGFLTVFPLLKEDNLSFTINNIKNPNIVQISFLSKTNQIAVVTGEQNIILFYVKSELDSFKLVFNSNIIGFNDEIIDLKFRKRINVKDKNEIIAMATNSNLIKYFFFFKY